MPAPFDTMMNNTTGGGGMPGAGGMQPNPTMDLALSSMQSLGSKSSNPTEALMQVDKSLEMAHQLIMKCIPQVMQWNSKLTKELHKIATQILVAKMDLDAEPPVTGAPPDMGMGATGLPPSSPTPGGLGGGFM